MIQNNIEFTINDEVLNVVKNKLSIDSINKLRAGKVTPIINAIAIDWNNAKIDEDTYINTTGDLINWIKSSIEDKQETQLLTNEQIEALNYISQFIKQIKENNINKDNYYYYVGLEQPTGSTIISNIVGPGQMGWHLIGDTLDGYSLTNPIYNGGNPNNCINVNSNFDDVDYYIALPAGVSLRDGSGNDHSNEYLIQSAVIINGQTYNIFKDHFSDCMFIIY